MVADFAARSRDRGPGCIVSRLPVARRVGEEGHGHAGSLQLGPVLDLRRLRVVERVGNGRAEHHVMTFYDAFSAGARDLFWTQMNEDSFSLG